MKDAEIADLIDVGLDLSPAEKKDVFTVIKKILAKEKKKREDAAYKVDIDYVMVSLGFAWDHETESYVHKEMTEISVDWYKARIIRGIIVGRTRAELRDKRDKEINES